MFLLIKCHLFPMLLITNSDGTLVTSEITSKETRLYCVSKNRPRNFLTSSKLFSMWLCALDTLLFIISCKYEAKTCRDLLIDETIMRNRISRLYIFGNLYTWGSILSVKCRLDFILWNVIQIGPTQQQRMEILCDFFGGIFFFIFV